MSETPAPPNNVPRRKLLQIGIAGLGIGIASAAAWAAGRREPDGEVLYNDTAWRRTDPALIRYREVERIPTGLQRPRALAIAHDGTLYIAGDRCVVSIAPEGKRRSEVACADAPRSLAITTDGTVLVGLRDRVQPISRDTAGPTWEALAVDAQITGLAAHPSGDVYAADAGGRALWRFRDGKALNRIGGEGDHEFIIPSPYMDVQIGPDGLVWVANTGRHRLEAYDQQDHRVRMWGAEGFAIERFCGCCNPADFSVLPDGRFITSEKGLPRVKRYAADGRFECVVAAVETFAPQTVGLDIAVAADGRVLILDPIEKAVRIYVEKNA
ncbi:MAG: NHL repeat-containing protein [Planctomycetota bacterium]